MRKHRRGPDALLSRKLDLAWSKAIRQKAFCEWCGRSDSVLHAHHIIGRRNHRTRWMLQNGCCICYRCHRLAHEEPLAFADWIRSARPKDVELLERVKHEISHWTIPDKEGMLADLLVPSAESEAMADE